MLSPLYPILDRGFLPDDAEAREALLAQLAAGLFDAGVTMLQYRNKQGSDDEVLRDARTLREHAPATMTLILNDRVALLAQTGFSGVHVGQQDVAPEQARLIIGAQHILGVSTHNEQQLRAAELSSADYVAIGPVYATASKADPDPVIGLEGLRRAHALTTKPLVAIGGITLANARAVREAGADSVAVISAIFPPGEPMYESAVKIAKDFLALFR